MKVGGNVNGQLNYLPFSQYGERIGIRKNASPPINAVIGPNFAILVIGANPNNRNELGLASRPITRYAAPEGNKV